MLGLIFVNIALLFGIPLLILILILGIALGFVHDDDWITFAFVGAWVSFWLIFFISVVIWAIGLAFYFT
jgi:hypothetical protein